MKYILVFVGPGHVIWPLHLACSFYQGPALNPDNQLLDTSLQEGCRIAAHPRYERSWSHWKRHSKSVSWDPSAQSLLFCCCYCWHDRASCRSPLLLLLLLRLLLPLTTLHNLLLLSCSVKATRVAADFFLSRVAVTPLMSPGWQQHMVYNRRTSYQCLLITSCWYMRSRLCLACEIGATCIGQQLDVR